MLMKPQFFYDHTTKQALDFQNPFYLKKAQQLEPKLYDGNVIKNTSAIVIPDSEETLMLAEESRSKMLLKQQDPIMLEKKVNTTPIDYAALNQLSQDFETRFILQTELSAEQAFWSQNSMNSLDPTPSCRPTKVKVPKELPKVSVVNTSLKKLKHHLAGFDVVIKERTTTTSITEGSWGFEHTKACYRDEIIPFVKALKDLFNTFDQYLIDELSEVQNVFHQMEQAVEQHRLESKTFEVKMNQVLNENERLLEQVINKDIVNIIMNSSVDNASVNVHECEKCLKLETELLNKKDFIEKETYDKLFRNFTTLEKHCISLEVDTQLNKEIFQRDNSVSNETLKDELRKLKGKYLADNVVTKHTITPEILKIDVEFLTLDCCTIGNANVQHSKLNANFELLCVKCNGCMLSDSHDLCVLDFINDVNARNKSKSVKKIGNVCPLNRITTTAEVPLRKPTALESDTPKPVVTLVYSRKPKKYKTNVPVSKPKNIKSLSANKKEPGKSWGSIVSDVPYSSLDECRVYYVEGLGHNLFSVGQFCDSNLEVAFHQHICFIRNLEGVDLLTRSRGNNMYTLSLRDMMASSPICLLSKASKTKSWLWHRRLSHLNFGAISEDEFVVVVVVKVVLECRHWMDDCVNQEWWKCYGVSFNLLRDCKMVVKEIVGRLLEEEEVNHFGKEVMILEWMFCVSILV
ncbi:hypothetical protein Tco_0627011 [Tanacetum coccineum]|uniref:GAG-pre-integrase domain-containing protein n=1 Tax=Tanacetum coccineum TaxID=301880 RepID=A0ABQ4WL61_9ASTR